MHQRALGKLTLWLGAPAPQRLRRGCPSALTGDTSVVSTASWALPNKGSPSTTTSRRRLSILLADRGRGRIHSWTRDHQLHDKPERQQTPRTIPDWQGLLLSSKLRGGGQGRRVDEHLRSEKEEVGRWDAREWQTSHWPRL